MEKIIEMLTIVNAMSWQIIDLNLPETPYQHPRKPYAEKHLFELIKLKEYDSVLGNLM